MEKAPEDTFRFIREHRPDDIRTLALQAQRYPSVDMPAAITQIAGWQAAKKKLPSWARTEGILYPARLSLEQCSSEITARYKAEVIAKSGGSRHTLTDLTGGFGIDCAFLSSSFRQVTYVERKEALCEIASHNFPLLNLKHISVCHEDSVRHLRKMQPVDWIFIDPTRRDSHGGKTVATGDCEPDVSALEDLLLEKARHVLIKLSPMLDLTLALNDLKYVKEVHVVSVDNECKELLLVSGQRENLPAEDIPVCCVNLTNASPTRSLTFTRQQEKDSACRFSPTLKSYLYEPNASILKAGAFRILSCLYKVEKLHPNSHLYTSDRFIPGFPGRKFRITGYCSLHKKEMKEMLGTEKKANLTVRNFPTGVAELRKRLKLSEGGGTYLFATTLADGEKKLIRCRAVV